MLPATQTGFNALSPQQQQDHRAKIGVRAKAILNPFWNDLDRDDASEALELESWMDVLENCSHSEIRNAWAQYLKAGPRTKAGRLYKPDPGAIYKIIMAARPKPTLVEPAPEPVKKIITADQARQISEEYGFGGVKVNQFGPSK